MDFLLEGQESKRLLFRKIQPADFNDWLAFHQNSKTSQYWDGLAQNPKVACAQDFDRTFFRYENQLGGKMALISKKTKEFIGLSGLLVQEIDGFQELEIAYSLLPKYWKQGYAIEAASQCKLYAIANKLALSAISIIHVANIPSQKVALKNGMKLDTTTDYLGNPVHIYRILL